MGAASALGDSKYRDKEQQRSTAEENVRVLVADDNREVRSALRLALREVSDQWEKDDEARSGMASAPCTILEADDARSALLLLDNQDIDLMLIDWELPGLDAAGVLPQIRARISGGTVIAMSVRPEAREQSLQAGADYFVGRNDPPAALLTLLREIWTSRGA
jgi:CheY-like chemotaxis protein